MLGIAISAVLVIGLVLPTHAQIEKSDLYIGLLLDFETRFGYGPSTAGARPN